MFLIKKIIVTVINIVIFSFNPLIQVYVFNPVAITKDCLVNLPTRFNPLIQVYVFNEK